MEVSYSRRPAAALPAHPRSATRSVGGGPRPPPAIVGTLRTAHALFRQSAAALRFDSCVKLADGSSEKRRLLKGLSFQHKGLKMIEKNVGKYIYADQRLAALTTIL